MIVSGSPRAPQLPRHPHHPYPAPLPSPLPWVQIQERLRVSDEDVSRMLHSLSCAKYKILLKEPEGRTISKTDKFKFNKAFVDRMARIKVRPACLTFLSGCCCHLPALSCPLLLPPVTCFPTRA